MTFVAKVFLEKTDLMRFVMFRGKFGVAEESTDLNVTNVKGSEVVTDLLF
jgi:hypothetical protein